MYIQVMKWVSIVALLLCVVFWNDAANYQLELNVVISLAAIIIAIQAFQAHKHSWAAGFLAIALLFNPLVAVFHLSGAVGLSLIVLSIAPFAISLTALKPPRLLSIPSITDRNPGSQSL
jgi:Family of unknown function (DUF6804)